jgi:hypothetical protein
MPFFAPNWKEHEYLKFLVLNLVSTHIWQVTAYFLDSRLTKKNCGFPLCKNRSLIVCASKNCYLRMCKFHQARLCFDCKAAPHQGWASELKYLLGNTEQTDQIGLFSNLVRSDHIFQTRVRSDIEKFWGPKFPIGSWKSARMPFPAPHCQNGTQSCSIKSNKSRKFWNNN